jgi:hypothetical protein
MVDSHQKTTSCCDNLCCAKEHLMHKQPLERATPDSLGLASPAADAGTLAATFTGARTVLQHGRRAQTNDLARLELAPFEVYIAEF